MNFKGLLIYLVCKFTEHKLSFAGECPYTGSIYDYCEKCGSMIPRVRAL